MNKYMYIGPFPWEQDGGAVVNYYNIKKQMELRPMDEYHGFPKVPHQLEPNALPAVQFPLINNPVNQSDRDHGNVLPGLSCWFWISSKILFRYGNGSGLSNRH